jgi:hypothetical protein
VNKVVPIYPEQMFDVTVEVHYSITYTFPAPHPTEARRYVEMMLDEDTADAQCFLNELTTHRSEEEWVIQSITKLEEQ